MTEVMVVSSRLRYKLLTLLCAAALILIARLAS